MKLAVKIILISIVVLFYKPLYSQHWTPPINVSKQNGFILQSDFTIDNDGIIHCVWKFKLNSNHGIIYYSKSDDDGFTWSEPENISQNDVNYCDQPYIVSDSYNNVYVGFNIYNYNPPYGGATWMVSKNIGSSWGTPTILTSGILISLVIDNNDRLYHFWYSGGFENGQFYYQYLEDTIWSEIFCPYNNDEYISLEEIVVDDNNNLHCVGYHDTTYYNNIHPMYLKYNYSTEEWGEIHNFSENGQIRDEDITLDTNGLPHICYGKYGAFYTYYNGEVWAETDTITLAGIRKVAIVADASSKLHITLTHSYSDSMQLYYYSKPDNINWVRHVVDTADNVIFTPELELFNNRLYLVYDKSDSVPYGDIFISKSDIITSTSNNSQNKKSNNAILQYYPNPFSDYLVIKFTLDTSELILLNILDLDGNLIKTLINNNINSGSHFVRWNGTNTSNEKVQQGIYFLTFETDSYRKFIKIIKN